MSLPASPGAQIIRTQDDYNDWLQAAAAYCSELSLNLVLVDEPRAFPFRVRGIRTATNLSVVFFTAAQARELANTTGHGMVQNYHALRSAQHI